MKCPTDLLWNDDQKACDYICGKFKQNCSSYFYIVIILIAVNGLLPSTTVPATTQTTRTPDRPSTTQSQTTPKIQTTCTPDQPPTTQSQTTPKILTTLPPKTTSTVSTHQTTIKTERPSTATSHAPLPRELNIE